MSGTLDFIRECGAFFVLSINDCFPAGRPFGAIMEHEGDLFISTNTSNRVHRQLRENGNMQIVAMKAGSRCWVRVTGQAAECHDVAMKARMMEECPGLSAHFSSPEDAHFVLFRIKVLGTEFN